MKEITKYLSEDDVEFFNKNECLDYEELIKKTNAIMNTLCVLPADKSLSNGQGYIQHDSEVAKLAKLNLLKLIKTKADHTYVDQNIERLEIHPSWVARIVSESGIKCLNSAWFRFYCMDNNYREYDQPFYASNPDKCVDKQLN